MAARGSAALPASPGDPLSRGGSQQVPGSHTPQVRQALQLGHTPGAAVPFGPPTPHPTSRARSRSELRRRAAAATPASGCELTGGAPLMLCSGWK